MTNANATSAMDFNAELDTALTIFGEVFDRLLQSGAISEDRKVLIRGLVGRVSVEFNNGFTSRMGDAMFSTRRVRLSAPLWGRATVAERRETVIHELAHIVTRALFPHASAHGREWKWVMSLSGGSGARTHRVDTSDLKRAGATFSCGCRSYTLGSTRVARIRKGAVYTCRTCRKPLVEVEVMACAAASRSRETAPASACRPRFVARTTKAPVVAPVAVVATPTAVITRKGTTADLIVEALSYGGERTVAELAAAIGKSECATNRYARQLVEAGTLRLGRTGSKATFAMVRK